MIAEELRVCAQCRTAKPAADFIGRRGGIVTYCSVCRTRYYRGAPHVSGPANVGPRRYTASPEGRSSKTLTVKQMVAERKGDERLHLRLVEDYESDRPRTRGDCANGPRPCLWVGCSANLYLDADRATGSLTFNFPNLAPEEMPPRGSCALDVADLGGAALEDVGELMNLTRERVRQIEEKGTRRVRRLAAMRRGPSAVLGEFAAEQDGTPITVMHRRAKAPSPPKESPVEEVYENEQADAVSVLTGGAESDGRVTDHVWRMLQRRERSRRVLDQAAQAAGPEVAR